MYHSITFSPYDLGESYNTWDDWHLIPTKRPHVGPPELEYMYQNELPYSELDLQNNQKPLGIYKSRSASWEFAVENGHEDWISIYHKIMLGLHGKIGTFTLEDDPEWYYVGRFNVKEWDSGDSYSTVTIEALCEPYKYRVGEGLIAQEAEDIAERTKILSLNSTLNVGIYANLLLTVNEDRSYVRIYGFFSKPYDFATYRYDTYIQLNDVAAGYSYEINGLSKEIITRNDSTGARYVYSSHVPHMDSFPTLFPE